MSRVWQWNRPVTVREVLEDLQRERSIAYTTVMTVMDNLHHKGLLRREQEGRAYRYAAVSTRAAYSAALMHEAWAASDNPAAALVQFFGMMSPEEREALRDAARIVQPEAVPDVPERVREPVREQEPGPRAERRQPQRGRAAERESRQQREPAREGFAGDPGEPAADRGEQKR